MTRVWLLLLGAAATLGFAMVVLVVLPGALLVRIEPSAGLAPYGEREARGRAVYIADGCVYCHSQQVRDPSFTSDVDRGWGRRASLPADYVHDAPHLLGTMRTGPDLLNVGARLPDPSWHLIHLYDPRAVVPWSIMPPFRHRFELRDADAVGPGDTVVPLPAGRVPEGQVVVAKPEAIALVAYLLSLRRDAPPGAAALLDVDSRFWCGQGDEPRLARRGEAPAAETPR
ncbi:MAG: cytochrome-c oxidase [Proteobacteria bacterium]|nr:MAG: cytochrome-c oxidase [Pseudomonadota bacterium]